MATIHKSIRAFVLWLHILSSMLYSGAFDKPRFSVHTIIMSFYLWYEAVLYTMNVNGFCRFSSNHKSFLHEYCLSLLQTLMNCGCVAKFVHKYLCDSVTAKHLPRTFVVYSSSVTVTVTCYCLYVQVIMRRRWKEDHMMKNCN